MKETILKSKTQFIITFAAIALMGSTLLMIVKPVSAQDGIQRPHGMRGQFRKHTEDKGNHRFRSAEQRMNRLQVIAGFLGLTPEAVSYTHLDVYKRQYRSANLLTFKRNIYI